MVFPKELKEVNYMILTLLTFGLPRLPSDSFERL
jgi:hypothetical protein